MKRAATLAIIAAAMALGSIGSPALAKHHNDYNKEVLKLQQQQLQLRQQQLRLQQQQIRAQQRVYPNTLANPYTGYGYGGNYDRNRRIAILRSQIGNTMDSGQKARMTMELQYLEGKRLSPR